MLKAGLKHLHNTANVLVLVLKSFVKLRVLTKYFQTLISTKKESI